MTEFSMWWTTGGAGDGAATYTRSDHALWARVLAACHGSQGVAPVYLNALAGSVLGANSMQIDTGGALVDGKIYHNNAPVNVNIPSAVGGGNTRIDRIVLRADWAAQTVRITRLPGTDAASPEPPAIIQNSGTLYDVRLYRAQVDTSGNVTLTDERDFAQLTTEDIENLAVTTAKIADNAISNAKLRDSAGLSVIGRGANSSGDPADIVASSDGHVLRRSGNVLGFGPIPNNAIGTSQIANGAVDDTKIGNRVLSLYRRQGGDPNNWSLPGTNNYTPAKVRIQAGAVRWTGEAAASGSIQVVYPVPFSGWALAFAVNAHDDEIVVQASVQGSTGFTINWRHIGGTPFTAVNLNWLAIGPE